MKYLKLQTDILKAADKRDRGGKLSPFQYGTVDNCVGVIVDGYYIVFIPYNRFYLKLDRAFSQAEPVKIEPMIWGVHKTVNYFDTGLRRTIIEDGRTVRIFTNKFEDIWIDEKTLKYFDLEGAVFKGTDRKSPLFIYEESRPEDLAGMILPVNHN